MTDDKPDAALVDNERGLRTLGRSVASRVAHEHPTLVFTLGYFALTAVGMIYDLWFFFYFKINILDYSETGDFLLAAIRNPLVILLSILPVGFLFLGLRLRDVATRKSRWYEGYRKKYEHTAWNSRGVKMASAGFFIVVYAVVFTQVYAELIALRIKKGYGSRVTVYRNNVAAPTGERPILLGTTTRFFFLYYVSRGRTEIVPVDNVALVTVDSRMRRERERDSLATLGKKP